jgi:hypothetical protein
MLAGRDRGWRCSRSQCTSIVHAVDRSTKVFDRGMSRLGDDQIISQCRARRILGVGGPLGDVHHVRDPVLYAATASSDGWRSAAGQCAKHWPVHIAQRTARTNKYSD